jgi:aspartokinase/homoserine dehydrogenase 1
VQRSDWIVHKFGGTSLADGPRIAAAAELVKDQPPKIALVVSAMSGVTDALLKLVNMAQGNEPGLPEAFAAVRQRHLDAIRDLLPPNLRTPLIASIQSDFNDVEDILRGVSLLREASVRTRDYISGLGEVWSAQIMNARLQATGRRSNWLDARTLLTITPASPNPHIEWEPSQVQLDRFIEELPECDYLVITGFVAKTADNIASTLGRNGSDFSAAIFGRLLSAAAIIIWTDVPGVLSANPQLVPSAVVIPELTYQEAMEMAYFGAKVLHPSTLAPAMMKNIPIYIRNVFEPTQLGTCISDRSARAPISPVKGFSVIEHIGLLNVEGTGMLGVPGIASRLFSAMHEKGINVILISQASSEHSICFAVPDQQAELARETAKQAFFTEIYHGQISQVEVKRDCAILAAVGDSMSGTPGVAAKFFGALSHAGINIRAIAQGSSERNISVVIQQADATNALLAAHSGFYQDLEAIR